MNKTEEETTENRTQETQIEEALASYDEPEETIDETEAVEAEEVTTDETTSEETETVETVETEETEESSEESQELSEIEKLRNELKETQDELSEIRNQSIEDTEEEEESEDVLEDIEPVDFISQEEAESMLDSPETMAQQMNNLLNKVFNMGREFAVKEVPNIAANRVNQTMTMKEKADKFYENNPELAKFKGYVGHLANKLSSKYDNLDDLFEATAKQAREELNITKQAQEKEKERQKNNNEVFPKKPGSSMRTKSSNKESEEGGQQSQINAMVNELGG